MSGTTSQERRVVSTLNPFRYRGYYYDVDTGLYYLQSRYYDPLMGRFINADGDLNANGDMIGFNMYAYCSNNPVVFVDPTGAWLVPLPTPQIPPNLLPGEIGKPIFDFITNDDTQAVIEAEHFAFYKGMLVIKHEWKITNGRSGSFGIMFLNRQQNNAETIKHEYGHFLQLLRLGIIEYTLSVAIPSVKSELKGIEYYSQPFEYMADMLGGVERDEDYLPGAKQRAEEYYYESIKRRIKRTYIPN